MEVGCVIQDRKELSQDRPSLVGLLYQLPTLYLVLVVIVVLHSYIFAKVDLDRLRTCSTGPGSKLLHSAKVYRTHRGLSQAYLLASKFDTRFHYIGPLPICNRRHNSTSPF